MLKGFANFLTLARRMRQQRAAKMMLCASANAIVIYSFVLGVTARVFPFGEKLAATTKIEGIADDCDQTMKGILISPPASRSVAEICLFLTRIWL